MEDIHGRGNSLARDKTVLNRFCSDWVYDVDLQAFWGRKSRAY